MIRDNVPPGAPCWVDLMSSNTAASIRFYSELFGWTVESAGPEYGGYSNFSKDGEHVAGLMQAQPDMAGADFWSVYLAVADAAETVVAAKEHGGEVHLDATPVGSLGVMAMVGDPGGAAIGMWQPGEHRGGVVAVDGAPCHVELHTRDYERSVAFYKDVFGWQPETAGDAPGFRYTLLPVGDGEGAGIMDASAFLPEGVPAHWSVYFAVADVDETLLRAEKLGGTVVMPGEDTPYGRLAVATDATGATFKLRGQT